MKKEELEKLLLVDSDNLINVFNENKEKIFELIPELEDEYEFPQNNPWHAYDVWNHTLRAMQGVKDNAKLRLVLLLHDIGKPHSYQDDENGIRHFRGHAEKSAGIASAILARIGYSEKEVEEIQFLIANHSTPIDVKNINLSNINLMKELLFVQYCDSSAYAPEYVKRAFKNLDAIQTKLLAKEKSLNKKEI